MALFQCPECGQTLSSKTSTCPYCGAPLHLEEEGFSVNAGNVAPVSTKGAGKTSTNVKAPGKSRKPAIIIGASVAGVAILALVLVLILGGGNSHKTMVQAPATFAGFQFVDLGLPSGTLWATKNVGANSPYDKGKGVNFDCYNAPYPTSVPSKYDCDELLRYCKVEGTSYGIRITSLRNGNSIQLPTSLENSTGHNLLYLTSSDHETDYEKCYEMGVVVLLDNSIKYINTAPKNYTFNIRLVKKR